MSQETDFFFEENPTRFDIHSFNRLLEHCVAKKTSDVYVQVGQPMKCRIHGRIENVTSRPLSLPEVQNIICEIYGINATARLGEAKDVDYGYEIKLDDRGGSYRFRVCATNCLVNNQTALEIVLRPINSDPPKIEDMKIPDSIREHLFPEMGLVLITGETGSGKSTLLASMIRWILENPEESKRILTYEQPIEFTYDKVKKAASMIAQTEIPTMLPNFADGLRNALRRDPNIVLVGELRDLETIASAILAAQTGHAVYGTTHSNSIAITMKRLVNVFPPEERVSRMIDLIDCSQAFLTQRLIRTIDGKGRVPIREMLVFDDVAKDRLVRQLAEDINLLPFVTNDIVRERGGLLVDDARRKYEEGLISKAEYMRFEMKDREKDMMIATGDTSPEAEQAALAKEL